MEKDYLVGEKSEAVGCGKSAGERDGPPGIGAAVRFFSRGFMVGKHLAQAQRCCPASSLGNCIGFELPWSGHVQAG